MKKLQRYVLLSTAKAFVPASIALVLLMAVGFCMQLLHQGLDVVRLAALVRLVFAYAVPMVLPSAFLTAVIMTFGRLAADNELTAVRAAGIPMFRVVHPLLWAACGLAVVAAYFQFETVPRAQGSLRAMKYEALKQILLDKAALSWTRRFSFPPVHILYDEFRDGRMYNVVVLEVSSRRPRTITTARSAIIRPDPQRREAVVFQMNDCVSTYFDRAKGSAPYSMTSAEFTYWIKAAPTAEEVLSRKRYLPLLDLVGEVKRLRRVVAAQTRLEDPEAVRKQQRQKLRLLQLDMAEHDNTLQKKKEDHERYALRRPHEHSKVVERETAAIADAQRALEELLPQRLECERELANAQQAGSDLERLMELHERQAGILRKIEAYESEIKRAQQKFEDAQRELLRDGSKAKELKGQIDVLSQYGEQLKAKQQAIVRQMRVAEDQEDLRDIRMRIHKRLSQALSVLTFALLGIPLGIAAGRRSVMIAFGLSFAVVLLVFYPLLILGQVAAEAGTLPLVPAIWGGNAMTLVIGAILTVKVLRQ